VKGAVQEPSVDGAPAAKGAAAATPGITPALNTPKLRAGVPNGIEFLIGTFSHLQWPSAPRPRLAGTESHTAKVHARVSLLSVNRCT
jgi:hypothetical protein